MADNKIFEYDSHIKNVRRKIASGDIDDASKLLLDIPNTAKKDLRFTIALADILIARKRFKKAGETLEPLRKNLAKNKSKKIDKVRNYVNFQLCEVYSELGDQEQVAHLSDKLLKNETNFDIHFRTGLIFARKKNHYLSEKHYSKCSELRPNSKEALFNLANALQNQRKTNDAIAAYTDCVKIDNKFKSAFNNRGNCLKDLRKYKLAIADYERAIKIDGNYTSSLKNAAGLYELLRDFAPAIKHIRTLIKVEPTSFDALFKMITLERQVCDWRRGVKSDQDLGERIVKLCNASPDKPVPSPFNILNIKDDLLFHSNVTKNYTRFRQKDIKRKEIKPRKITKRSKIKIGYFSSDFHNHATMHLMIKMLELHDKKKFAVECFSFGPRLKNDEYQNRVVKACNKFHDLNDITNKDAAELAQKSKLDIAIDLKGYTTECRPEIMAYGVAPIQINYLGYPASMAADFSDYILSDDIVLPEKHEKYYSEKVLRLPNSYQVNDNERKISRKKITRKDCGLDDKSFVFCNFNNSYKIGPNEFDAWCEILKLCPRSVLWLLKTSDITEVNLKKEAEKRKIDAKRIIFGERKEISEHLRRIQNADIALDTFNYNSHTTGSDVLWAGVPLITKIGDSFPSRVGASLLSAVGLSDLICDSTETFVKKAISLYKNKSKLQKIKDDLKKNKKKKPLFNTEEFTRDIEDIYSSLVP